TSFKVILCLFNYVGLYSKSIALRSKINWIVYWGIQKVGVEIAKKLKLNTGNISEDFKLQTCPDCGVIPGEIHKEGCDVERCSACGEQRLLEHLTGTQCKEHDPGFARWTGFWPGSLESDALGIDMNTLLVSGLDKKLFVKPKK
ncbi:MAG: hypothetical protein HF312_19530, partial [Ignavibacteria bacterium]|nr:hypothetical protein [Ignavibacteria bacterium]MCU7522414.1 hypothetical protein [Ignavibacteria bacterium]